MTSDNDCVYLTLHVSMKGIEGYDDTEYSNRDYYNNINELEEEFKFIIQELRDNKQ